MNRTLPPGNRGHRSPASGGTSRRRGALPGSGRLVRRTPDVTEVRPKTGGENIALARRCLELIRDIADRGALSWDPEQLGFALQELIQVLLERTGCDDRVFEPMPAGELNDLRRLYEELDFVDAASKDMQRPN